MTKPTDLTKNDDDGDDIDARPTKQKLIGLVVPWFVTQQGSIRVNY